jgi:hypothetical protein
MNLLTNGGFDAAGLGGWQRTPASANGWAINDSQLGHSWSSEPFPAAGGRYNAYVQNPAWSGAGLEREITLPAEILRATLRWQARMTAAPRELDPTHPPDFVVSVTVPDRGVTRTNFALSRGDYLGFHWQSHAADLTEFAGERLRVCFLGRGNTREPMVEFHLDEVEVEVVRANGPQFTVLLATNTPPASDAMAGQTNGQSLAVAQLAPDTTYYWQVQARLDTQSTNSSVGSFRTGARGQVQGFAVATGAGPHYEGVPGALAVTAHDAFGYRVEGLEGGASAVVLRGGARRPQLLIAALSFGSPDSVTLANVSGAPLAWPEVRVTFYDRTNWPAPVGTVRLTNIALAVGGSQTVYEGISPLRLSIGKQLDWARRPDGTQCAAVLLHQANGEILDFVAVGDATPAFISQPLSVPVAEWLGQPLPPLASTRLPRSWCRVGGLDTHTLDDWESLPGTAIADGMAVRFLPGPVALAGSHAALGPFAAGVAQGEMSIGAPGTNIFVAVVDAAGHAGFSAPFTVQELPPLRLGVPAWVREGDGRLADRGAVYLPFLAAGDLAVSLSCSDTNELRVPETVIIPAGSTNATFDFVVQDDTDLDGPQPAMLEASAPRFAPARAIIRVADNETAALHLRLPPSVREGEPAVSGDVDVSAAPVRDVELELSSPDAAQLVLPPRVVLPAGTNHMSFALAAADDRAIEARQSVRLTVAAPDWASASATIDIDDNESRDLALWISEPLVEGAGVMLAGGEVQMPGGITPTPVEVRLASDPPDRLILPDRVIVPAGGDRVRFDLGVVNDDRVQGLQSVRLTAAAAGFNTATNTVSITDDDPAAFLVGPVASPQEQQAPFTLRLAAVGPDGKPLGAFTGMVTVTARDSLGREVLSPRELGPFSGGRWEGLVAIPEVGREVVLRVAHLEATGQSGPFDILVRSLIQVPLATRALVADPIRPRLYATVPPSPEAPDAELVALDALTGAVAARLVVGANARALAASRDGQFLFVGVDGRHGVQRVELATLRLSLFYDLGTAPVGTNPAVPRVVRVLASAPGWPDRFAALVGPDLPNAPAREINVIEPGHRWTALVRSTAEATAGNIAFGDTAEEVLALAPTQVTRLGLGTTGLVELATLPVLAGEARYAFGRVFGSSGRVYDAERGTQLAVIDPGPPGCADGALGRLFALATNGLRALDLFSLAPRDEIALAAASWAAADLVRWGADGFAARNAETVFIARSGRLCGSGAERALRCAALRRRGRGRHGR